MNRLGKTRKGKIVELNRSVRVEGGWKSYVLNNEGLAVLVFVPSN
jgi:hypothetical protein